MEVIVDFDFDPDKDAEFDEFIADADYKPWAGHRTKAIKYLNQFQKKYGVERSGMTSWTTTSMTAFVTSKQLDSIMRDKRVIRVTENELQSYSGFFAATDSIVPGTTGESLSWGWKLTTNTTPLQAGSSERLVYVIDAGIANHADLNVVRRTNVACGTGAENCSNGSSTDQFPVVGCYPHATHVAGIIGARGGNSTTNIGVYAGVKLVSVGVQAATDSDIGICAASKLEVPNSNVAAPKVSTIGYALDWVRKSTLLRVSTLGDTRVPIVSMSINSGQIGYDNLGNAETNRSKLLSMVNPAQGVCAPRYYWENKVCAIVNYPGAFFVQSAGNQTAAGGFIGEGRNVCTQFVGGFTGNSGPSLAYTHAYPNNGITNPSDGIMVIGAIRSDGAAVDVIASNGTAVTRQFSPTVPSGLNTPPTSSNFGGCLDAWAPGNRIYSTWCQHATGQSCVVGGSYTGNGQSGTQGWAFLSGTSMAAPHVAGAAAYLADALLLTTPASIEQAVRARLYPTGYSDQGNKDVNIVQVP